MPLPRISLVLLLPLAFAAPLAAQTVQGRVLDAATGDGVPGAVVAAVAGNGRAEARVRAGQDGAFTLRLRGAGTYRLRAERAGYRPTLTAGFDAAFGETLEVDLRLSVQPLEIEPLTVTARRAPRRVRALEWNGFYRRREQGLGTFIEREQFERYPSNSVAQIIERNTPGTHLLGGTAVYFARAQGGSLGHGINCWPAIYLDGVKMTSGSRRPVRIDNFAPASHVEAVEVYRSAAEIPAQYNTSEAGCGVILIWTRTGS